MRHSHPRWTLPLLSFGALFLLAVVPVDRRGSNALEAGMALATALAGLSARPLLNWRAVLTAAVGVIAGWLIISLPTLLPGAAEQSWKYLLRSRIHLLWMPLYWLALPCLIALTMRLRRRRGWGHWLRAWPDLLIALLCLHVLWCSASSAFAFEPKVAYTQLREDLYPFAILFVLVIRAGRLLRISPEGRRVMARWLPLGLILIPLVTALAMAGVLVAYHAGWITQYAQDHGWVQVDHLGTDRQLDRIVFPFSHHNRTACYLLIAGLAAVGAGMFAGRRPLKALGTVTLLACGILTWFTLTRGALLAWIAAVLVAGVLSVPRRRRQILAGFVLLVPIIYMVLPPESRQHLADTARILQAKPGAENTINSRMALWQITLDSIRRRPLTGFGYGTGSFEATMQKEFPQVVNNLGGSSHAHNILLEVAAENGLPAAGLLLTLFTVLGVGVAVVWRRLPPRSRLAQTLAIGLVLLAAIFVYGVSNYPLRRALGIQIVFLSSLVVALADYSQARYYRFRPEEDPKLLEARFPRR